MKYLVLATAAEQSGAKQVVMDYYDFAISDRKKQFIFLTSKIELEDKINIYNISIPWIKKSLFHRLYFELFHIRGIIKKHNVSELISLQNLTLPTINLPQTIIINQAIPFSKYKIGEIGLKLWFYKLIYGHLIKQSINKAQIVVVQANWLRDHLILQGYSKSKIKVLKPKSRFSSTYKDCYLDGKINLFYPTSSSVYKNYYLLLDALKKINPTKLSYLKLRLTLNKSDITKINDYIDLINLGVLELVGYLDDYSMEKNYLTSILVFPSLIETFGYPLVEAREIGAPILVSDLPYSRDVLKTYSKVKYFSPTDSSSLANLLESIILSYIN